ncbi:flavonol synthase 1-like [Syzygium oleosum]|uniref:flavonol synthase 1-like n=1 Tax=Syzygium oleosum TaxID=219896 RepID=UPI0024B91F04|nr:flavonol synthase 1-like [Syzygium oleosum]
MEVERVQALATVGLDALPAQFVRPSHERPENSRAIEGVTVPVISLSQPHHALVCEIHKACREWGSFLVTDHGIPPELVRRLQEVGREFFRLPQEEKEKYANDPSRGNFEGYGTKMTKNHDEKVEWVDYFFHLMHPPCKVRHEIWPQHPPSYREVTEKYNKEILRVTEVLLELISEGLGLEKNVLKASLGGDQMELEMKINLYPPCPQPQLALGVEPHTDMSALTILVPNEVPGLQAWKDGYWYAVDYLPNALFFHVGDQIEVLSNGKYKSVLHRSLVNKEKTRMSWAVFCAHPPPQEVLIGPLPGLINDQNPAKYSTKTYAEFRYRKFNKVPR